MTWRGRLHTPDRHELRTLKVGIPEGPDLESPGEVMRRMRASMQKPDISSSYKAGGGFGH